MARKLNRPKKGKKRPKQNEVEPAPLADIPIIPQASPTSSAINPDDEKKIEVEQYEEGSEGNEYDEEETSRNRALFGWATAAVVSAALCAGAGTKLIMDNTSSTEGTTSTQLAPQALTPETTPSGWVLQEGKITSSFTPEIRDLIKSKGAVAMMSVECKDGQTVGKVPVHSLKGYKNPQVSSWYTERNNNDVWSNITVTIGSYTYSIAHPWNACEQADGTYSTYFKAQ